MDSFELNKLIAAILMVALLIIGIGKISNVIFHVEKPKTPGYSVELEQATTMDTVASSDTAEEKILSSTLEITLFSKYCHREVFFDDGIFFPDDAILPSAILKLCFRDAISKIL